MAGNVFKNKKYLELIKASIETDPKHPKRHGVKMQAHHLISAEGMKQSGFSHEIAKLGYDINVLENLVFIPCTLQGACHLKIQPHRGNHTAPVQEDIYDDDRHPKSYHDIVARRIKEYYRELPHDCVGNEKRKADLTQIKLNELSSKIMALIQNMPSMAPLTNIAKNFSRKETTGCGGVDSVSNHKGSLDCPTKRDHRGKEGADQNKENISYVLDGVYKLRVGK